MTNQPHIPTPPAKTGQADFNIGAELRTRRDAMGKSQTEVAAALKMQPAYIRAIENLDVAALPSIGYALGYVRAYAGYVGLDGAQAVARYKIDSAAPEDLGRRKMPHFVPKTKIRLPRGLVAAITVLSCAAVVTFWYGSNTPSEAAPGTLTDMLDEAAYAPAALPDDATILTLKAVAPSWVQVSDAAGRPIMSRIMVTGESWSVSSEGALTLSARDGAAIELYAGRERLGPFGEKGVAFTGKPLAASAIVPKREDTPLEGEGDAMTPIKTK